MNDRLLESKTLKIYIQMVKREFPLWYNKRLNPTTPMERFDFFVEDVEETLRRRKGKKVTRADALRVYKHLLKVWPGGILGYNSWYAIHTAQDMGFLDEKFRPIKECGRVDEESRRMGELAALGGPKAVAAYMKIMGEG